MSPRANQTTEPFTTPIAGLEGKTVASAVQESGDFHGLDDGYESDGPVVVTFTDGSTLSVYGLWCNDGTASVDYEVETPAAKENTDG